MRKLWPFTFNFFLYAAIASVMPFIVLYYQDLGFTGTQIGVLTGISPLIVIFSAPLWTGMADTTRRHQLLMSAAILAGAVTLISIPLINTFVPLLLIVALLYFFIAPITPFVDSATMFMLGNEKEMYGRIRLGGTIGFGLAAPFIGVLVQNYGMRFAFWGSAAFMFLGFIISQKLVFGQAEAYNPATVRIRTLVSNPHWVLFLIMAFTGGLTLAAFNNYLFPYMNELDATESMMGLALTIGTISEIPTLFFGNLLIRRLKSYGLLMLSMVISGLRMLLFAASGTPTLVLVIQLLNGLTIPAMWVAGVSYADEHASAGMSATVQGLFSAIVLGFGTAAGGFIGGLLLENMGGHGLFLVFGTLVLTVTSLVALIRRYLPSEYDLSHKDVID